MQSKMENPTQTYTEKMSLVLQLIEELQIKSKTVMSVFVVGIYFYYQFFLNKWHIE